MFSPVAQPPMIGNGGGLSGLLSPGALLQAGPAVAPGPRPMMTATMGMPTAPAAPLPGTFGGLGAVGARMMPTRGRPF